MGAYIIRELIDKGYKVRAICRNAKRPQFIDQSILDKVEWVEGDILDIVSLEDAMDGIDSIINSAGFVSFIPSERKKMYQVNVDGTANVMNMALEKKIRRLVHISSVAAIGRTSAGGHVDENKKWEESPVNTHYAISKFKGEMEVWRAMAEGLSAVILNPSTILGYGDWNTNSCAIFKSIYNEFKYYTSGINGFVDVEDVARVSELMMNTDITEERYIVNAENWEFKRLMDNIAENFHKKKPSRQASEMLLGMAWRFEKFKAFFSDARPLLTRESAKVGVSRTHFDNQKLLAALPHFKFKPLENTLKEACIKYQAALSEGLISSH